MILYLLAGSGLVALAAVLIGIFAFGGENAPSGVAAKMSAAGCTFATYPGLRNDPRHRDVPTLQTRPNWNSFPPTSGPHYGETAIWGFYDEPIPLVRTTHNLEHGGVIIHYGRDVPQAAIDQLRAFYNEDPAGLIVAPLPRLGDKIALSAWFFNDARTRERGYFGEGQLATCTQFDEDAFRAFVDAYRFKGREGIPPENMQPGQA